MKKVAINKIKLAITVVIFQCFIIGQVSAQSSLWTDVSPIDSPQVHSRASTMPLMPSKFRLLSLDESTLTTILSPLGVQRTTAQPTLSLDLPMPNGKMVNVLIAESVVLAPSLASKYPDIKTYRIQGSVEDVLSGRLDFTPQGFHAMLDTIQGTVFIDPRQNSSERVYISYYKNNYNPTDKYIVPRSCGVDEAFIQEQERIQGRRPNPPPANRSGDQLRTYRLAVAATGEYTTFQGGTVALGMAGITTTINRVNQIYNRDLSVNLELVANNNLLVYTDGTTDPYNNNDATSILSVNTANLDTVIGNSNYDVGHVFSTGAGGLASLAVICNTSSKARGVTGTSNPMGDPFDIDFVAHELGHQFSGNHTFNGINGNCSGGSREPSTAFEPGSGSTIQGYAGICGADNLQNNTDAMFSTQSIDEMIAHTVNGGGNVCAATSSNGNTAPNVNAGTDYTIPARTPFEMTGTATDVDGDTLTYSWEQFDLGLAQAVNEGDNGSSPLFRVFLPTISPTRSFPQLNSILNNTSIVGETLPTMSRDALNLRLTVRDQQGGVDKDTAVLSVEDTGQGFEITSQNSAITLSPGSSFDITWNVAGTTDAPISCAAVDILMSVDGGQSFPTTLASSVPNDGSQSITLPNNPETQVRFKVKCSNNIFFDINNANIVIDVIPVFLTYEDVPTTPLVIDNASTSCIGTPITRTINVTDAVTVNNMAFGFTADHSYRGDIQVSITSPNLTTATVIASSNDGDDNYDVSLDDSQTLPLDNNANDNTASPFYDRGAAPSNSLSVFNGENTSGDWLISMCDSFAADNGLYYRSILKFSVPDFDSDGIPDFSDSDDDNDGAPDASEIANSTDPFDNTDYPQPYLDVVNTDVAYTASLLLTDSGIVEECASGRFCPNQTVTNNLFAVWALRSAGIFSPPTATSSPVSDVDIGSTVVSGDGDYAADWIVEYLNQNLTFGCDGNSTTSPTLFCPQNVVSKASAAFLVLRAMEGATYTPPEATGAVFADVASGDSAADWIEELFKRDAAFICEGNSESTPRRYCPQEMLTRGELANLLQRVFELNE